MTFELLPYLQTCALSIVNVTDVKGRNAKMKKRARGVVKSDKMDKPITVNIERLRKHPRYENMYDIIKN
jgi:hypothetical protein